MNRKQYSPEMKMQIVKETLETGNASIVARRHDRAKTKTASVLIWVLRNPWSHVIKNLTKLDNFILWIPP